MNKTDLLVIQGAFVARLETMTAFLGAAIDTFKAVNHTMTPDEKTGFHYCVEALRRNARGVIDTGKMIQEMEATNG